MLILEDLSVIYPDQRKPAIDNVSLKISEPGIYLIAGRSGSGKSTLARTLFGLIPHIFYADVEGKVEVMGINPVKEGPIVLAGKVGFVAQNPEMFISSIMVRDELVSQLSNIAAPREKMKERLDFLAKEFNLFNLLDKPTLELSSGQMQLLAIASALALDPHVLILDEPFARLDNANSIIILNILRKISREKIILVFEHHLDLVLSESRKVFVLDDGRIIFEGSPKEAVIFLKDVDLPEITESFLFFRKILRSVPLNVEEAVEVIKNYINK